MASINRLLRFVGIITAQYVGVEPREICQARWNQWQRLTAALGLAEDALALTLDAPSRALLLLLQSCAAHGNKTATFTVRSLPACLPADLKIAGTGQVWCVSCCVGHVQWGAEAC